MSAKIIEFTSLGKRPGDPVSKRAKPKPAASLADFWPTIKKPAAALVPVLDPFDSHRWEYEWQLFLGNIPPYLEVDRSVNLFLYFAEIARHFHVGFLGYSEEHGALVFKLIHGNRYTSLIIHMTSLEILDANWSVDFVKSTLAHLIIDALRAWVED